MRDRRARIVQVAGGPKIDMQYGRKDGTEDQIGDTSGLPAGDAPFPKDDTPGAHLRAVFGRMGFNDQEIVALSGAHTLGRAFKNRSGAARAPSPTRCTPAAARGKHARPRITFFLLMGARAACMASAASKRCPGTLETVHR